ncbi:bifunctional acetyl-CoA hydrolase/transferase family protein/GNAT family N-acetyltransferase [Candidatus Uabimicrobium amorphum]|uniref:4-hydroxybutyrate CoA-transferase n=1 Tax=Uabimicrobium amorphum TaxID=2596890 RepID=A0A5S9IUT7_UABAM|nr:bifunctional acetyl-CoA hydrolase/transferase family protein/GNAT family N-acetyltransferase [Candidatus Uabimicrobium amorphum]BBM88006.1 4-hydroxybutyrate CoA-transferase [Candidatus Uabimicrobium amorphum]
MYDNDKLSQKTVTAKEAVTKIKSGQKVFIGSGAAVPQQLMQALAQRSDELYDTELVHILTLGVDPTVENRSVQNLHHATFFVGANIREEVQNCEADYTPIFLSEIPQLFTNKILPIDVALVQLSPPNEEGFCSYGVSVDIVKSAVESADYVIAEINTQMPRTQGDSFIHIDNIDQVVLHDSAILEYKTPVKDDVIKKIGGYIAMLIDDGATLQIGIGSIPDAVLAHLHDKKDLGIHTEMFSDGILPLIEKGVITNNCKTLHRNKIITSFVMGSKKLYDFVDNNPNVEFHPSQYTNDPFIIAKNDNMVAINSALQVDLTGQVCADSIGHAFYSGIGGQLDFIRGAARSISGKPIIALPSTAKNGEVSRIVTELSSGAGVVTTRGDVHYVVTEYGIAYLHGKSIRQRALSLINIAHPKFRAQLLQQAKTNHYLPEDQITITSEKNTYPQHTEKNVRTKTNRPIFIRPLKSSDEDLIKQMFYSLSDKTIYFRAFTTIKYLPRKILHHLVHIDYDTTMALCAIDKEHQHILGVARYYLEKRSNMIEIAVVVRDDWQNQGIGRLLINNLIQIARERGVRGVAMDILAENNKVLNIIKSSSHKLKISVEAGICHVKFLFDENE